MKRLRTKRDGVRRTSNNVKKDTMHVKYYDGTWPVNWKVVEWKPLFGSCYLEKIL